MEIVGTMYFIGYSDWPCINQYGVYPVPNVPNTRAVYLAKKSYNHWLILKRGLYVDCSLALPVNFV